MWTKNNESVGREGSYSIIPKTVPKLIKFQYLELSPGESGRGKFDPIFYIIML